MFGQGFNYGFLGKPPCFTDTTDIFKDNSGVALYTLDYDGSDAGGASGKFGEGAVFNGSSSKITLPSSGTTPIDLSTENWTVSLWFKQNARATTTIFSKWGSGTANVAFIISVLSSDNTKLYIGQKSTSGATTSTIPSQSFDINVWNHLVVTRSSTQTIVYLNNIKEEFSTTDNVQQSASTPFIIGAQYGTGGGTSFFNGSIDQVRLFNRTISTLEAATLYNETKNTTNTLQILGDTSCIATYTFDGSSADLSGNYSGTETDITYKYDGTPTAVDFGVGGKSLYGARFNGSSSYIDLGASLLSSKSAFSVSTWVKFDNLNTQNFIFYNSESGSGTQLGFYDYGNGNIYFQPDASTSNNRGYISNSGLYTTDEWTHIVMVFDGSATGNSNRLKAYIQGQSITLTYDGTIPSNSGASTCNSWIGGRISTKFSGDIDQVRIFNKAISAAEVSKLYGNGAGEIACAYKSTTNIVNYPTGTTPVAYYKLDNSSEDYSTGGNDGTDTNIEYRFGRFGQAAVFDGYNSIIEASNVGGLNNATAVSASLWFNWDDSASVSNYGHIINIGTGTLVNGDYFGLAVGDDGGAFNRVLYGFFVEGSTSTGQTVKPNAWHHAVIVYEGTSVKYYYNGSLIATHTKTSLSLPSSGNDITIGEYAYNGNHHFKGQIDQVRIYNAALTSDQVEELYNEKPEVDTSNFKTVLYEGTGATQYISNVGFQPDLVWIKNRDQADSHRIHDSIRGVFYLESDTTSNEVNGGTAALKTFESNGFTIGTGNSYNTSNEDYVAWCWKGGGDAIAGTGTGVTNVSVSANTEAGFSIVKFTGGSGSGQTVEHGLDEEPEIYFLKGLDNGTDSWIVCGNSTIFSSPTTNYLRLNTGASVGSTTANAVGSNGNVINVGVRNYNGQETIAYCFHSVDGFSKIGSYNGNGSSNGPFIHTGFKPAWLMVKWTNDPNSNSSWVIYDNARNPINPVDTSLRANNNSIDSTASTRDFLFLSNGFKADGTSGTINDSSGNYIYMAFK